MKLKITKMLLILTTLLIGKKACSKAGKCAVPSVEALIVNQTSIFTRIKDAYSNYEKKYKNEMSIDSLTVRKDTLKNNRKNYQANDHKLHWPTKILIW